MKMLKNIPVVQEIRSNIGKDELVQVLADGRAIYSNETCKHMCASAEKAVENFYDPAEDGKEGAEELVLENKEVSYFEIESVEIDEKEYTKEYQEKLAQIDKLRRAVELDQRHMYLLDQAEIEDNGEFYSQQCLWLDQENQLEESRIFYRIIDKETEDESMACDWDSPSYVIDEDNSKHYF